VSNAWQLNWPTPAAILSAAAVFCLGAPAALAAGSGETLLQEAAGFSASELTQLKTQPVIKQLEVEQPSREFAVVGAVRVAAPRELYVEQFRDTRSYLDYEAIEQSGRLETPPRPKDLAPLRLPDSDLEVLATCQLAACKFKLPRSEIDWMQTLDWNSTGASDEATARIRQMLLAYAERYEREGQAALMVYADKPKPARVAQGLDHVLNSASIFLRAEPALARYVREFPKDPPDGAENFLYWSVEEYGYRPVTSLAQGFVYRAGAPAGEPTLLAQKQLYASHYFLARVELSALYDASDRNGPAMVLVYLDRTLFDDDLNWAKRKALARGVRSALSERLTQRRDQLEKLHRSGVAAR
jgi:hypothetical protein